MKFIFCILNFKVLWRCQISFDILDIWGCLGMKPLHWPCFLQPMLRADISSSLFSDAGSKISSSLYFSSFSCSSHSLPVSLRFHLASVLKSWSFQTPFHECGHIQSCCFLLEGHCPPQQGQHCHLMTRNSILCFVWLVHIWSISHFLVHS